MLATVTEPIEVARAWLKKQGYSLEYRVARQLRSTGFSVTRGRAYVDPQEPSKWREADIDARLMLATTAVTEPLILHLSVECKRSSAPWVVFTDIAPKRGPISGLGPSSEKAFIAFQDELPAAEVSGFMVATADDKGGDKAFEALNQAYKAADSTTSVASPGSYVVMPVVVTDTATFAVSYDAVGVEILDPVSHARIIFNVPSGPTIIDLVALNHLADYLDELKETVGEVARTLGRK
jgi:hypothetical protein